MFNRLFLALIGLLISLGCAAAPAEKFVLDGLAAQSSAAFSVSRRLSKNYVGPLLTVARSSDSATRDIYTDSQGNLDTADLMGFVGSQNLLLQSSTLASPWTVNTATITSTSATVDPFGGLTAHIVSLNSIGFSLVQQAIPSIPASVTYTKSVYLKYISQQFWQLVFNTPTNPTQGYANFDIQNGLVGTVSTGITASITPVGNGWFRISATYTTTSSAASDTFWLAGASSASTGWAGGIGTSPTSAYVYGPQVNIGSLQPYQPTASVAASGNGYLTKLYDQSGNSGHVVQTNAAYGSLIVSGGLLQTLNGQPAMNPVNGNNVGGYLYFQGNTLKVASATAVFNVTSFRNGYADVIGFSNGGQYAPIPTQQSGFEFHLTELGTSPVQFGQAGYLNGISRASGYVGAFNTGYIATISQAAQTGAAWGTIGMAPYAAASGWGRQWPGNICEVVLFPAALSTADRNRLETNQGNYYGIGVSW